MLRFLVGSRVLYSWLGNTVDLLHIASTFVATPLNTGRIRMNIIILVLPVLVYQERGYLLCGLELCIVLDIVHDRSTIKEHNIMAV